MIKLNAKYVYRYINNKIVILNLQEPDEVIVLSDSSKVIFELLMSNNKKCEIINSLKEIYDLNDEKNIEKIVSDFMSEMIIRNIIFEV